MQRKFLFILGLMLMIIGVGCSSNKEQSSGSDSKVHVRWKLLTNFRAKAATFEARFVMVNKGSETLNDKNWAMFFSMSPRQVIENETPQPAVIEHLNGDWYKMVPASSFKLAPGDSLEVRYLGIEGVLKETDAPIGLYIVKYNDAGEEESIEQVTDYVVEPFETKEQRSRGAMDKMEIGGAEKIYGVNERHALTLLPESEIQKIIPSPVSFQVVDGQFSIPATLEIGYQAGFEKEAEFLKSRLAEIGVRSSLNVGDNGKSLIQLNKAEFTVNGITKEAYKLKVADRILVEGNDRAGVFYGIQSMFQMIPPVYWERKNTPIKIQKVQIEDAPRFEFRSQHIDITRNFQTKESIKRMIDLLAFYKINHLLLVVCDDEGWRVEIDGLPELTEVSGKRGHVPSVSTSALHPGYGSGPTPFDPTKYGSGFYTKADFIEILKYADQRSMTVIPSVNVPGHARAAIKAMEARYERLMKEGDKEGAEMYRLVDPEDKSEYLSPQFYRDNVVSVARPSTYRFYEKVMDEYMKMYSEAGLTLKKFHTGGDEVAEGVWSKSPMADELMKNSDIKNPKNLHIHLVRQLLPIFKKRGIEFHGWEEIALEKNTKGIYVPNPEFVKDKIIPYIWNNLFDLDLGYKLANAGYPVVLCNVTNLYNDMAYDNSPEEPSLYWGGFTNLRSTWEFAPYNFFSTTFVSAMGDSLDFSKAQNLKPEARKNIYGIQAQLWCEMILGRDMMEYQMLPKLMGYAESAWTSTRTWEELPKSTTRKAQIDTGWNVFVNRVSQIDLPRLRFLNGGYAYRVPTPGLKILEGQLHANSEFPNSTIYFTTDGTEPTINSQKYNGPIRVENGRIRARAFDITGKGSRTVELQAL